MDREVFDWLKLKLCGSDFQELFLSEEYGFCRPLEQSTDLSHRQCLHKIINLINRIKSMSQ